MYDGVDVVGESPLDRFLVADVALDEGESWVFQRGLDITPLDVGVVEVVEVVERDDVAPGAQECFAEVRADETRCSGDDDFGHALLLRRRSRLHLRFHHTFTRVQEPDSAVTWAIV